jgi:ribosome-associated toxin RatA of RatAB toxin-antitoxin module
MKSLRPISSADGLTTSIDMPATPDEIMALVQDVTRWPVLLPHYRNVSIVGQDGEAVEAAMSAMRGPIPIWWRSLVAIDGHAPSIVFNHTGGFTAGMIVTWTFRVTNGAATTVTITHDPSRIPSMFRKRLTTAVVGRLFIDPVARRTLQSFRDRLALR